MKSLYIMQKDLRIKDNKALTQITQSSEHLALCYLLPDEFDQLSMARRYFIFESIKDLSEQFKKKSHVLYVAKNIDELIEKVPLDNFDQIFISKAFNSKDREIKIKLKKCHDNTVVVENSNLYKISDLPFAIEKLPDVFSNFRRKIEKSDIEFYTEPVSNFEMCSSIEISNLSLAYDYLKSLNLTKENHDFNGGEQEALKHLESYLWDKDLARTYKETRNGMIDFNDSTKLSPWMSLGCISPGVVIEAVNSYEEKVEKNESTYWIYFEVLWREYFKLYSHKYGEKIFNLHGLEKKRFQMRSDNKDNLLFDEWKNGELGLPFVDANMKELLLTGWMSNRGRQNVASYLSKDLMIDWRRGAQWFSHRLIDYDVESNWGNWNYAAGVGVDPRDRKFNIERQASMYDTNGEYVNKWLKS